MTSSAHSTLPRLDSSSSFPATGGSSSAPLSRDGSASSSTQPHHHKGGILLVPSPSDSLPCPSPTPSSSGQSALSTAGGPSKIHFAPLPPAPERRHSISLGVASRSSLLHSQGSSAGGKSASGGGGGDGQVKWVAMTDEEWDAYKRQYGVSTGGEDGVGGGEVPDLGTFVLKGGKKMLNKLRSMSTSSSVSSSSTDSSAALGGTPSVDATSDDRKGLMRFGRGRNRSVSPAGSGSPASSVPPPVVVRRASSAGPAGTPDVVDSAREDVEPRAIAIVEEQPEEEEEEQQVVVVRNSRPPSPAPVRHRSPPPSESEYIPSEGESEDVSSTRSPSDVSSAFSDSDDDEDSAVDDYPSEAPAPSTAFPHHPTPPGSGSATPHAAGTRSRSASITIAALPSHPGRRSSQLKEDERERLILGFAGSLERVALDRQAKGE